MFLLTWTLLACEPKETTPVDTATVTDTAQDTDSNDSAVTDSGTDSSVDTGNSDTGSDTSVDTGVDTGDIVVDTGDTSVDTGDTGIDTGDTDTGVPLNMVADFSLADVNTASSSYGQPISPRDYLQEVSGWYFIKAT